MMYCGAVAPALLAVLLRAVLVAAQTETPAGLPPALTGRCMPYTGTECAGIVFWDVFVPDGQTIADLDNNFKTALRGVLNGLALLPNSDQCVEQTYIVGCALWMPKCDTAGTPPLPARPCRDTCTNSTVVCLPVITPIGLPPPDCTANAADGYPFYPDGSTAFPPRSVVCQPALSFNYDAQPTVCVDSDRLVFSPATQSCVLSCRAKFWAPSEVDKAKSLFCGLSVVSLVFSSVLLFSLLAFPSNRQMPTILLVNPVAIAWAASIVSLWDCGSGDTVACDGVGIATSDSGPRACVLQGMANYFGVVAALTWWTCIAVNLFVQTVLGRDTKRWHLWYHAGAYGGPLLTFAVYAGTQDAAYQPVLFMCSLAGPLWAQDVYLFPYFYISIIVSLGLGLATLAYAAKGKLDMAALSGRAGSDFAHKLVFVAVFGVVYSYMLYFLQTLRDTRGDFEAKYADYVLCTANAVPGVKCEYTPPIGYGPYIGWIVLVQLQGFFMCLIFMTSRRMLGLWQAAVAARSLSAGAKEGELSEF